MSGLYSITLRTWGDADLTRYLHGRQKIPSFLCTKRCVQGVVAEEAGGMPLVVGGCRQTLLSSGSQPTVESGRND